MTPLDKVLFDVVEVAYDHERVEEHERGEASRREERLMATGEAIRHAAMERRRDRTARAPHRGDEPMEPVGGQGAAPPRSRRRKRSDSDDEDVVGELQRFEDRRSALAQKKLDLMEKQLEQQREFHAQVMACRDRERQERQRRQERSDVEQRRERTAFLHLMDEVMKKLRRADVGRREIMSSGAGGMIAWGGFSCLVRDKWCVCTRAAPPRTRRCRIRPSCQEPRAPTVARVIQIGLCGVC